MSDRKLSEDMRDATTCASPTSIVAMRADRAAALEARAELAEARLVALHMWCAEPGGTQSIYGGRDGTLAERADCIGTLIAYQRKSLPELAEALRVAGPEGTAP